MYKKNILKQTAEKIMQKENKNSFGKNFEKNISVTAKDGTKMENFRMLGMGLQEQIDDIREAPGQLFESDIEITDTTKGLILKSPDATRWRITVDNTGALIITSL